VKPSKPSIIKQQPVVGLLVGLVVGVFVYAICNALGLQIVLTGRDVTAGICTGLSVLSALLGFSLGRMSQENTVLQNRSQKYQTTMRRSDSAHTRALRSKELATLSLVTQNVSMSMREPLQNILQSTHAVRGSVNPELAAQCDRIRYEINFLTRYVNRLHQFAQPLQVNKTQINFDSVVENVKRMAAPQLDAGGISVSVSIPEGLPMPQGDPDLIETAVYEIVDNAILSMGGGGKLELRANASDNLVFLEVADSGPGIAFRLENEIFVPFFTTRERAAGLGLATAERIAKVHNGMLRLIHDAGAGEGNQGTCVRLLLPRGGRQVAFSDTGDGPESDGAG